MSEKAKTLIPKLRFSEFKNDDAWNEVRLEQLGELVSGLTYRPEDIRDSGLLVLRSSNVQNGEITLDDNVYVRPDVKGVNLTKPNDILICVRNGSKALIGKNALIPEGMDLCTHGAFMTVFRSPSAKFVFQLFQTSSYQKQVDGDLGATINSINGSQFIKYKFYVPKPLEQQKIADCLSSIDELIRAQAQKIAALKDHKKGLMQRLFPREGENVPKLRFPEFGNAGDWEEKRLGEISIIKTGSSNREDSTSGSGAYTFFDRSQDVRTSNIFLFDGEAVIIAGEGQEFLPKYFVGKFDLHQRTYAIMDFQSCHGLYLFYYIYQFRAYFLAQAVGSTVKSLRLPMFQNMLIALPKLNEQKKIADCLSSIDDLISTQTQQLESYKIHKKGLMQKLFPLVVETDL
jgi:type I restriction enzyme S subunit